MNYIRTGFILKAAKNYFIPLFYTLFFLALVLIFLVNFSANIVQAENIEIIQHDIKAEQLGDLGIFAAEIEIINHQEEVELWLGYSIRDSRGEWHDLEPQKVFIEAGSSKIIPLNESIFQEKEIRSGEFLFITALWDSYPQEEARRLTEDRKQLEIDFGHYELEEDINDENYLEAKNNFTDYNFLKASHRLGRGRLNPANITKEDEIIKIKSPANSYQGGEIRTEDRFGYGSYKIEMKTDYAPGSFAAFFLYQDVRGSNDEIDIEIYNDGSRQIDFVTFVQGEKTNYKTEELPFDPSSDYHEYRIDYFPDQILFYVENELMAAFTGDLPSAEMKVMVNHWWPNWLEAESDHRASEIKIREIEIEEF